MTNQKNQFSHFYDRFFIIIRGAIVFFLIIMLLIPQFAIQQLVKERKSRQNEVQNEVMGKWATQQTVKGPLLLVPVVSLDSDNKRKTDYLWYKPNQLNISGNVETEVKYRSIYKVILYRSDLHISGQFKDLIPTAVETNALGIQWHKALICMGITDYSGLEDVVTLQANDTASEFSNNPYDVEFISNGLAAPVKLVPGSEKQNLDFNIDIKFKGSQQINFLAYANQTKISIESPWTLPSFTGKTLPDNTVSDSGFTAKWNMIDVKHTIADSFYDVYNDDFADGSVGVILLQGQDHYSKTERSIKYALLLITLTFVVYMFIELLQKKRINVLQYVLVGAALLIFYTLLLSISEYTGFNKAYLIAAAAVILQISLYTGAIFKSIKTGSIFGVLISALYLFVYALIQLEDYALLAGSVGLFVIVTLVMIVSRKIQWNKFVNEPMDDK